MSKYCKVLINATSKEEADKISDTLITKKLIAGSLILKGTSRYWWDNKITERKEDYCLQTFSLLENKSLIIKEVEKMHSYECPIIAFVPVDGNQKFLDWIEKSVQ